MCGLCAGDYVRLCAHHYVRLCVETLCADYVSVLCRLCVLSEKIKFIPDTIETSKITPTRAPPPAEEPWPPTSPEKATQIIQTIIEHKQNHTAKGPHHTHTGGEAPPALHLPCPSAAPTPPWNSVEKTHCSALCADYVSDRCYYVPHERCGHSNSSSFDYVPIMCRSCALPKRCPSSAKPCP